MTVVDGITSAALPTDDRGLHYGDGVFETIALHGSMPQHWARHLARMEAGARRLGIAPPDEQQWRSDLELALADAPATPRRVLKLILTRGSGGRGYAPPVPAVPRRLLQLTAWPAWPADIAHMGIRLALCGTPLGRNRVLAGIKHLNRLEQVLGAAEVAASEAQEGLMFDDRGVLVEGTRTNVFIVIDGCLLTPVLDEAGIAGIMRSLVLDAARSAGIATQETQITRDALDHAQEIFVCNSLAGVWPVRELLAAQPRQFTTWPVTGRVIDDLRSQRALP